MLLLLVFICLTTKYDFVLFIRFAKSKFLCIEKHMNDQNIGEYPYASIFNCKLLFVSNSKSCSFSVCTYRYSPLSPADFFAAASYLPAAAAAAASATTLTPSTGKLID